MIEESTCTGKAGALTAEQIADAERGVERLQAAVADFYAELVKGAMREAEEFPEATAAEQATFARAAAGRSLDRILMLVSRRVKGAA